MRVATSAALTLVYVDVDDFKQINDTLGHPQGDRVLRRVASIMTESLPRLRPRGASGRRRVRGVPDRE